MKIINKKVFTFEELNEVLQIRLNSNLFGRKKNKPN